MGAFRGKLLVAATLALLWAPAARADEVVPFKAFHKGFADPVFNKDGTISNKEVATGVATYVGKYTLNSMETAVFTGPNTLHVVCEEFTLTAANGDVVIGSYETTGTVNFDTFIGVFVGTYKITGGTGRFANATGSGTLIGVGNMQAPFEIVGALVPRRTVPARRQWDGRVGGHVLVVHVYRPSDPELRGFGGRDLLPGWCRCRGRGRSRAGEPDLARCRRSFPRHRLRLPAATRSGRIMSDLILLGRSMACRRRFLARQPVGTWGPPLPDLR
jgi:hypothetical protein